MECRKDSIKPVYGGKKVEIRVKRADSSGSDSSGDREKMCRMLGIEPKRGSNKRFPRRDFEKKELDSMVLQDDSDDEKEEAKNKDKGDHSRHSSLDTVILEDSEPKIPVKTKKRGCYLS